MDDCWNHIGISGDGSCPELTRVIHCRNCEVYARAGRRLLEQPPPAGYLEQWALQLAAPPRQEDVETLSTVLFRLASERLALPTAAFVEAVEMRPVHRIPHRSGGVLLGVVNIRGELQLCVSLPALLNLEPTAEQPPSRPRLAVVERDGARWVFPVDALLGVHRVPRRALAAPPATIAHDAAALTAALFDHDGERVALLDAEQLFTRLGEGDRVSGQETEDLSLLALFRTEVESYAAVLSEGLVALEANPSAGAIEPLMRAAHSIKGAARVVGLDAAVRIAHAMEDALVAAQAGRLALAPARIDLLLRGLDWIGALSAESEETLPGWLIAHAEEGEELERRLTAIDQLDAPPTAAAASGQPAAVEPPTPAHATAVADPAHADEPRAVKVTAEALSRLIGLAAESLVEARRLEPLTAALQQLKARQLDVTDLVQSLRDNVAGGAPRERMLRLVAETQRALDDCRQALGARIAEFDALARQSENLSGRLYDQMVSSRLRPFGDATPGLARLVRDVARQLGKQARLEIRGRATEVDREILEQLEAPLNHLLRNAVDHAVETPEARLAADKPAEGRISVEAVHSGGMLLVRVADDGSGIDPASVRRRVIERGLAGAEMAERLSDSELFEFLLLPGFSTREAVSEISGRGVGLDAVQAMVQGAGGSLRISSTLGQGTLFELRLPVTRSVLRALVVDIAGEAYAVPLARAQRALAIDPAALRAVEGRPYVVVDGESIALVPAREVLGLAGPEVPGEAIAAVVVGERGQRFALEVDGFRGESDLVVRPLDPRLGKVPDVAAASTLQDGSPVLILDVEDLVRSIDVLVSGGRLTRARRAATGATERRLKRVLVVEDSLTVRELERRLLESQGYAVEVAVDGMEGWNAVQLGEYDLVLSDVDMPRLNGIELVRRIKADPRLHAVPVVIVSYKDRDEDRLRGLEAGADHYLTKSSFQDETLARVVRDLIGGPAE